MCALCIYFFSHADTFFELTVANHYLNHPSPPRRKKQKVKNVERAAESLEELFSLQLSRGPPLLLSPVSLSSSSSHASYLCGADSHLHSRKEQQNTCYRDKILRLRKPVKARSTSSSPEDPWTAGKRWRQEVLLMLHSSTAHARVWRSLPV